jgi:heavy metal efflux system protein
VVERLVAWAAHQRILVIVLFSVLLAVAIGTAARLDIDAFPDTTPVQVAINTVAPALNAVEIEQQITLPVELALGGLPGVESIRSISKFGLSQVVATFSEGTGVYQARQFILERITGLDLAEGVGTPQLGPVSTGLGEIFHYLVRSPDHSHSLEALRTLHDWVIKPELLKVAGVAEINAWGGHERQYHVIVSPDKLVEYGLTMGAVFETLEKSNRNVGGGQLVTGGEAVLVHGRGRVSSIEEIEAIVLSATRGVPVRIADIAEVAIGHEIRQGAVTADGAGEAVLGLGFMLMGENSHRVATALAAQLAAAARALPAGVEVEVVYNRTELVDHVVATVRHNLAAGAALVVVVLFLIMGSFRAGVLVAVTIPMAMLFAVLGMHGMAIAATLLSLGAMDFGILVNGSVVMTEANLRALDDRRRRLGRGLTRPERLAAIVSSARQVARPIGFGMGIILVVFLPILTLEGTEGKMFKPMAWTFIFALAGAVLVALLLTPVLSYYFLPSQRRHGGWFDRVCVAPYGRVLEGALRWRGLVLGVVLVLVGMTATFALRLGGEFVPRLNEGALVFNIVRLAGISLEESAAYNTQMERLLLAGFPDEVAHVWSRIGTAEVATDPMGTEVSDLFVTLRPRAQWTRASSQDDLAAQMEALLADLPGQNVVLSQPIEMRMNELTSGMRANVGIEILGDDFEELARLADEVHQILAAIPGAVDISVDQITGQPTLQVDVTAETVGRYAIAPTDVLDFLEALGNRRVGDVVEGQRVFPLVVRLPDDLRRDAGALADSVVPAESGLQLPLAALAEIEQVAGLATINRSWGRRMVRVQANVRDRDLMAFVEDARGRVDEGIAVPPGYFLAWSGQFEHLARSQRRLLVVVPLALALIFVLLYLSLNSLRDVLIVYTGIPFAAVGGILALYWRGIPFSVSAAIGFIALSGIAVLDGQVLIAAIRQAAAEGRGLADAVVEGAKTRFRPVLATSITDALGFLPMALSTDVGAEVQRPLATVVVGGVISSTVLTLIVLPILYVMFRRGSGRSAAPGELRELAKC